jgi:hypothetical protein
VTATQLPATSEKNIGLRTKPTFGFTTVTVHLYISEAVRRLFGSAASEKTCNSLREPLTTNGPDNKSLDRSGGSVFYNLIDPAELA